MVDKTYCKYYIIHLWWEQQYIKPLTQSVCKDNQHWPMTNLDVPSVHNCVFHPVFKPQLDPVRRQRHTLSLCGAARPVLPARPPPLLQGPHTGSRRRPSAGPSSSAARCSELRSPDSTAGSAGFCPASPGCTPLWVLWHLQDRGNWCHWAGAARADWDRADRGFHSRSPGPDRGEHLESRYNSCVRVCCFYREVFCEAFTPGLFSGSSDLSFTRNLSLQSSLILIRITFRLSVTSGFTKTCRVNSSTHTDIKCT